MDFKYNFVENLKGIYIPIQIKCLLQPSIKPLVVAMVTITDMEV